MKNTLFRPKLRFKWLLLSFLWIISSCGSSDPAPLSNMPPAPVLLVIGEDLSRTFKQNAHLQLSDVEALCKSMLNYRGGGKISIVGIGNSTPKGHLSCVFDPLQVTEKKNPTPSEKRINIEINRKIMAGNTERVETFLVEVGQLLAARNQNYTDINGFLTKANLLVSDPDNEDFTKYVFVNSDGKQSTPSSNKVDCKLKPDGLDGFFVSGWVVTTDCQPDNKFLSPAEFVNYFKKQLKSFSKNK